MPEEIKQLVEEYRAVVEEIARQDDHDAQCVESYLVQTCANAWLR